MPSCCCGCCDRCLPFDCLTDDPGTCDNPLPATLTIDITATPDTGSTTCFNGSGTLTFKTPSEGGLCCWEGTLTGTCLDCNGVTYDWELFVSVCCSNLGWLVTGLAGGTCGGPGSELVDATTCDPVLLSGCWTTPVSACFVGCLDDVTPIPSPEYTICFEIYETP